MAVFLIDTVNFDNSYSEKNNIKVSYEYLYIPEEGTDLYKPNICLNSEELLLFYLSEGTTLGRSIINQNFEKIESYINNFNKLKDLLTYQTFSIDNNTTYLYKDLSYETNIKCDGLADITVTIDYTGTDNVHGKRIRIFNTSSSNNVYFHGNTITPGENKTFISLYGVIYNV